MRRLLCSVLSLTAFALLSAGAFAPTKAHAADEKAWDVRCKTNEADNKEYCEMFQMIAVKETGSVSWKLSFSKMKKAKQAALLSCLSAFW